MTTDREKLIRKLYALKAAKAFQRHHPYLKGITCEVCGHHHGNIFDSIIKADTDLVRYYGLSRGITSFEIKCKCPESLKSFERPFSLVSVLMEKDPYTESTVLEGSVIYGTNLDFVRLGDYAILEDGSKLICIYENWWIHQKEGRFEKIISRKQAEGIINVDE